MKKYTVQKGDSLNSIAAKFGVKDGQTLRSYHNIYCPLDDLLGHEAVPGKELLIPEEKKYLKEENPSEEPEDEDVGPLNGYDDEAEDPRETSQEQQEEPTQEQKKEDFKNEQPESSSTEHDGKYFVIPKGKAICDKGTKFPNLKVTSHQKHYWNDADGKDDYLAVTEDDTQFNPPAVPFGNCSVKNGNPCAYAPAGKWTKTYEKIKVMGKSCVTELSELMCATGGKIKIMKHGQQSEASKSQVQKADAMEQHVYNPIMDFEGFQEEIGDNNGEAW